MCNNYFYLSKCLPHPLLLPRARLADLAMGRLNVALLRYLSKEDFRVLTAVSRCSFAYYRSSFFFPKSG